jgi:hypothetical protein
MAWLLVAAQVFLSAPVASALASVAASADTVHCAGMMPAGDRSDPCPCCPEGDMGTAACLSACTASAGVIQAFAIPQARATAVLAAPRPLVHRTDLADPPLKPPPIG